MQADQEEEPKGSLLHKTEPILTTAFDYGLDEKQFKSFPEQDKDAVLDMLINFLNDPPLDSDKGKNYGNKEVQDRYETIVSYYRSYGTGQYKTPLLDVLNSKEKFYTEGDYIRYVILLNLSVFVKKYKKVTGLPDDDALRFKVNAASIQTAFIKKLGLKKEYIKLELIDQMIQLTVSISKSDHKDNTEQTNLDLFFDAIKKIDSCRSDERHSNSVKFSSGDVSTVSAIHKTIDKVCGENLKNRAPITTQSVRSISEASSSYFTRNVRNTERTMLDRLREQRNESGDPALC